LYPFLVTPVASPALTVTFGKLEPAAKTGAKLVSDPVATVELVSPPAVVHVNVKV